MVMAGCCWLCILANLHLVVQSSAPPWVQARAMSVYLLCFFAAASAGSALWGWVAQKAGLQPSLEIAAGVLVMTSLSGFFAPLIANVERNLEPSKAWPHPEITVEPPLEHGPILVTVEYQIDPIDAEAFREAAEGLRAFADRPRLLRAMSWGVMGFELAFPLTLLWTPALVAGLVVAGTFHLANACLFGLNRFFWTWLSAYPAILWLQGRIF